MRFWLGFIPDQPHRNTNAHGLNQLEEKATAAITAVKLLTMAVTGSATVPAQISCVRSRVK
jgi:hypothetical protein